MVEDWYVPCIGVYLVWPREGVKNFTGFGPVSMLQFVSGHTGTKQIEFLRTTLGQNVRSP